MHKCIICEIAVPFGKTYSDTITGIGGKKYCKSCWYKKHGWKTDEQLKDALQKEDASLGQHE